MARTYDAEKTVDRILTAASALFMEKGFQQTSMQEIAAAAGVSKGAVYHHFPAKEAILTQVKARQSRALTAQAEDWLETLPGATGREKLSALLHRSAALPLQDLDRAVSGRVKSPEFIVSYMHDCVDRSAPLLARLLRQGVADGSLRTDFPQECGEALALLLNIWCDPAIFSCGRERLERKLAFLRSAASALGLDVFTEEMTRTALERLEALYPQELAADRGPETPGKLEKNEEEHGAKAGGRR